MLYRKSEELGVPSSPLLFHPLSSSPSPKKCGLENKNLLTFSRSTLPKNPPTLRRKNPHTPRKNFLSNVENSISEVKIPFFGPKKRRKPFVYGLSPLRWYKDNTFSAATQIALTFRNTFQMRICSDLQQTGSGAYYITRGSNVKVPHLACKV